MRLVKYNTNSVDSSSMIRNTQSAMEENHHGKVETSQSVRAAVESSTISKACQVRDNVPCTTEPVDIRTTSIAPEYLNRGTTQCTQGRTTNSMDDNSTKAGKHNTTSNTENDAKKVEKIADPKIRARMTTHELIKAHNALLWEYRDLCAKWTPIDKQILLRRWKIIDAISMDIFGRADY